MPSKTSAPGQSEDKTKDVAVPYNWPNEIQFLPDQTYSTAVTTDLRSALSRTSTESATLARIPRERLKTPCPWVNILTITNEKHPAKGQRGLFAAQQLEPDSLICLYLGHVHTNSLSDTDAHSDYDLSYDRETGLSIDAAQSGNESRFANDYRGIAQRPNAEWRDCLIQVPSDKRADGVKWERRVGIFVLPAGNAGKRKGGIKAGDEILVSYGKGFWESRHLMAKFRKDFEMRKHSG